MRTTCGEYAHLHDDSFIFSFDWISFFCDDTKCTKFHTGRIYAVAKNHRILAVRKKVTIFQIQKAFAINDFNAIQFQSFNLFVDEFELIFTDRYHFVSEAAIMGFLNKSCNFDYNFGEDEVSI